MLDVIGYTELSVTKTLVTDTTTRLNAKAKDVKILVFHCKYILSNVCLLKFYHKI